MNLTQIIENSQKQIFSIEITPPLKTKSIDKIFQIVERVAPYNPAFVSVTYHQQTIVQTDKTKHIYQRHASNVGVCSAIKYKYEIEVVPHFICGGFDTFETEDALFNLEFMGIKNILALRGDPKKGEESFTAKTGGHKNAAELVKQIVNMGKNKFSHHLKPKEKKEFCIGVAGYPEVHKEAENFKKDILWLKHKVDCGAEFIITQMFFDFELFIKWERACRDIGIKVPIIPGIKPITKKKQIRRLKENFGVHIPDEFVQKMEKCGTTPDIYNCGIDECVILSQKLIESGSPIVHYFTMGNGRDVEDVIKRVFI